MHGRAERRKEAFAAVSRSVPSNDFHGQPYAVVIHLGRTSLLTVYVGDPERSFIVSRVLSRSSFHRILRNAWGLHVPCTVFICTGGQ